MIIVGANTQFKDGRTGYWFREEEDIHSAKAVTKWNNEAIHCSNCGIVKNWFMLHDTSTNKSWSVYGIGLSKRDYIVETTESFIRRIKQMALPTYDKSKRQTNNFEQLPKDAYVIKIMGAKEDTWGDGSKNIRIAFDIAEGKYAHFYQNQFDRNTNEDKQWPFDAVFTLNIPNDQSPEYVWRNWNTFFADLEDSNSGFVFDGDLKKLKGKLIGGKFHNKQTEKNGNVYDHIVMKWTCVAEDVRNGKAGRLPNDKLIGTGRTASKTSSASEMDGFLSIPEGAEEELPF